MKLIFVLSDKLNSYGQVRFGFLFAPGQVKNFTISAPLPS